MFGIGMQELVLIFVLALLVVGPKKLPEVARALGKGYAEFRRAFDDMKRSVETEVRADELRRTLLDVPPPPPPVRPESLLPGPAPVATASPYPEIVEGGPPPAEPPRAAGTEGGGGDGREESGARA